jgi:hypothetical protein
LSGLQIKKKNPSLRCHPRSSPKCLRYVDRGNRQPSTVVIELFERENILRDDRSPILQLSLRAPELRRAVEFLRNLKTGLSNRRVHVASAVQARAVLRPRKEVAACARASRHTTAVDGQAGMPELQKPQRRLGVRERFQAFVASPRCTAVREERLKASGGGPRTDGRPGTRPRPLACDAMMPRSAILLSVVRRRPCVRSGATRRRIPGSR